MNCRCSPIEPTESESFELVEHIENCEDLDRLEAAFAQALDIHSLSELRLEQGVYPPIPDPHCARQRSQ